MTQPLKLIGLTGPAGCGKDTVAKFLCDTQEFRQISLAEPIKLGIVAMFGIPMEYLTDRELKEQPLKILGGKSPRQVMQTLGTEWAREMVDEDIWINIAQQQIDYNNQLTAGNNLYLSGIVISDIRFESEAKWLRDQGGTIWHIRRPDNPLAINADHASEQQVQPLPGEQFIINDGGIDQLYDHINDVMTTVEPDGSYVGDAT
ncbi:hypothetical protein [Nitrosomonas oligotropha]|uniref:deoxynucleotide monophosphate kinase family protein n=1 Tax=Nitrosomonas oligotropha TaxID=42354 RepID=UPI0013694D07|nr:hypothetical protein [Nitrosomonas oligotropha]MXS84327.1 hypothetical protein [Nitrosomonas oligotropha]